MSRKKRKKQRRNPLPQPMRRQEPKLQDDATPSSRGRLWLFRMTALLLAPAIFLLLLEGGLRLFGYGFSPHFFLEELGALRTNPAFTRICFPPEIARVPVSDRLAEPKQEGEYRIYVLGASAAQGFPKPAYSFGRMLEVMLQESYPAVRFKVVNAAVAAINSHIVLPIAKDCLDHEADLLVVYLGNNEVVGPFGPGTVFAGFSPSLSIIRASLGAKRARTGQLMGNLLNLGRQKSAGWAGMEMFVEKRVAADDPRMRRVYGHFRDNLSDIVEAARDRGVPVVVSDLVTNLRDSPPFASMHATGLGAAELARWQDAFDRGVELEAAGRPEQAAEEYRTAKRIDDRHAELHYRLARCLLSAGEEAAADAAFRQAQELDVLRFRADDGINFAVRDVAEQREHEGVYFVDAAAAFADPAWSDAGIPGEELFDDHVHMNFAGNYLLARELFRKIVPILPSSVTRDAPAPEAPSQHFCAQRLVFTEWERGLQLELIDELTDRPPFTGQAGHDERREVIRKRLREMDRAMSIGRLREIARLYDAEIGRAPGDPWLRLGYAKLLVRLNDLEGAVRHLSTVVNENPAHREALWELSKVLAKQGRFEEEARYLERVLRIEPFFMQARNRQAINLQQRGKKDEAVEAYLGLLRDYPGNAHIHGGLARVLMSQGKVAEATAAYREALALDPDFSEARTDLVRLMVARGDRPAAIAECEEWIKSSPDSIEPLLLLADVLERGDEVEAAAEQYRRAIAKDPRSIQARTRYGMLLQKRGAIAAATEFHRKMLESDPEIPAGHYLLGVSLARQGQLEAAIAELREELKVVPESHLALNALARILSSAPDPYLRDGAAAVAAAEKLKSVDPSDPSTLEVLAMAYAESGDFNRAVEYQTQAVQLLRTRGQREQARLRDYMERLQLYRRERPYRQGR
jgi:tetratricopeptide (TPR) repeat protein